MMLLIFILYVFAIVVRQLSQGTEMGQQLFPTVWRSISVLIIEAALCDNVGDTMETIMQESRPTAFAYGCCIFLASLTVMNMLVGVLCEVVSAVAATEKEELAVHFVRSKISQIL